MRPTLLIALVAALIAALTLTPPGPAQDPPPGDTPPAKAVSFDDVLKMVRAGQLPGEILDSCDTVFTLSPEQTDALTKAGAPPALIDALQRKRMRLDDVVNVIVILDCSGSMRDLMPDKRTKMDGAKAVVSELIEKVPEGRNLCFMVYGHDEKLACEAVKVVRPLGPLQAKDKAVLREFVALLKPTGHTPIANSLRVAGEQLARAEGLSQVVLITDGQETCGGKPAEEARQLTLRKNVRAVEVIGFGVTEKEKAAVEDVAREGRGRFYDTKNPKELANALSKTVPGVPDFTLEDDFTPLFNGKDLDGWEVEGGDPKAWTAEKGELAFTNRGEAGRNWLITRKEYENFILRLDFQLSKGTNSGIAFRYKPGDEKVLRAEVQVIDDRAPGADTAANRKTGALYGLAIDRPAELKPTGEWNSMEVKLEGRQLTVTVNGKETVSVHLDRFADRAAKIPGLGRKSGRIGLQSWAGSGRFRNIRIRELAADPAPKKRVVPTDLPTAVRNLIEALSDENPGVRVAAAAGLGKFQDPAAIEALCDALRDKDGRVRRAAADSLAKNGTKSEVAADALAKRVADDIWLPFPEESFGYDPNNPPPYDGLGKGWGSKDHALAALRKIAPDRAAPALVAALKSRTVQVRRWAAAEMGSEKGEAAVAALATALSDSDPRVRRAAADSLARIGNPSEVAVDALVKRVGDDAWVPRPRETVWFDPDDPPAYDDHKDWGSKHHALQALRKLAPDRVEEALTLALRSKNPEVRKWAAKELAAEKGKNP